jgi:regulator of sigma E protease
MLDFIVSNLWPVFLIVLFFGGSIFVHELGHFLAARKRGLVVQRFSIGFGPKIFSWTRNGVEYRLSWLPLGGYVALPQLADMAGIEGESDKPREQLPPLTYADKMIVSVMGAVFNVIFAFLLACLI